MKMSLISEVNSSDGKFQKISQLKQTIKFAFGRFWSIRKCPVSEKGQLYVSEVIQECKLFSALDSRTYDFFQKNLKGLKNSFLHLQVNRLSRQRLQYLLIGGLGLGVLGSFVYRSMYMNRESIIEPQNLLSYVKDHLPKTNPIKIPPQNPLLSPKKDILEHIFEFIKTDPGIPVGIIASLVLSQIINHNHQTINHYYQIINDKKIKFFKIKKNIKQSFRVPSSVNLGETFVKDLEENLDEILHVISKSSNLLDIEKTFYKLAFGKTNFKIHDKTPSFPQLLKLLINYACSFDSWFRIIVEEFILDDIQKAKELKAALGFHNSIIILRCCIQLLLLKNRENQRKTIKEEDIHGLLTKEEIEIEVKKREKTEINKRVDYNKLKNELINVINENLDKFKQYDFSEKYLDSTFVNDNDVIIKANQFYKGLKAYRNNVYSRVFSNEKELLKHTAHLKDKNFADALKELQRLNQEASRLTHLKPISAIESQSLDEAIETIEATIRKMHSSDDEKNAFEQLCKLSETIEDLGVHAYSSHDQKLCNYYLVYVDGDFQIQEIPEFHKDVQREFTSIAPILNYSDPTYLSIKSRGTVLANETIKLIENAIVYIKKSKLKTDDLPKTNKEIKHKYITPNLDVLKEIENDEENLFIQEEKIENELELEPESAILDILSQEQQKKFVANERNDYLILRIIGHLDSIAILVLNHYHRLNFFCQDSNDREALTNDVEAFKEKFFSLYPKSSVITRPKDRTKLL